MKINSLSIILGLGGLILGAVIVALVMRSMAPSLMIIEDISPHSFKKTVELFEQAVAKHGWKLPAVHDLQATMKKYGKDVRSVKVFELCHPDHAGKILSASEERIVSSMMPCRVAIYEKADGKVYISRMNSGLVAGLFGGLIADVMAEASAENEEILKELL